MHAVTCLRSAVLFPGLIVVGSASCGSKSDLEAEGDVIGATERDRLHALVQADGTDRGDSQRCGAPAAERNALARTHTHG